MATTKPVNAYSRQKHTVRLKDWALSLKEAIDALLPSGTKRYRQVAVIGFHWENDDMGVSSLEDNLLKIFKDIYNFNTESYTIPTANCASSLQIKLGIWSQHWARPDVLRIYVYSGHAGPASTTDNRWYIAGRAGPNGIVGPRIYWHGIRDGIENCAGDVCYILDCCSAGSAATYDGPEILAAVGWEQIASSSLAFSFTQTLIDKLRDLNGQPATLANLYSMIFRDCVRSQIGAYPVHIPKKGRPSIVLSRVPGPRSSDPQAAASTQNLLRRYGRSEHRVLLSVQFQHDIQRPDVRWMAWLTNNLPPGLLSVDIQIEAYFQGSNLLLVTVPVEVWTMLPADNSAFNFVGHVSSNNILPQMMSNISSSLPVRKYTK
ncbi:hypothetical protein DTO217A2_8124 [Paecilomyces variotii]|nr:hypothetical protein DTO217A2_8124 [Paecilomyces variotii]